jgi:hypothetical protein
MRRGLGKPETFNFLGFTFICGNGISALRTRFCPTTERLAKRMNRDFLRSGGSNRGSTFPDGQLRIRNVGDHV